MKIKGLFYAMLLITVLLTACGQSGDFGGPLPTLVTELTGEPSSRSIIQPEAIPAPLTSEEPMTVLPDPSGIGDDVPVSRALVAKMLALTYNDMNTIQSLALEISFTDTQPGAWYEPYVNIVCLQGLMNGAGEVFMPDEPLTLGQANELLLSLNPSQKPGIALSDENRHKPVSYALWVELYKKLLEGASEGRTINEAFGVEAANVIVLAVSGNNPALAKGQMITDVGAFSHKGMNLDAYIDKGIKIFHKDKEIIALAALTEVEPTLRNAYIIEADTKGVRLFSGGAERYYDGVRGFTGDAKYPKGCADVVGDVTIRDGQAVALSVASETLTGTVMKTTAKTIEFKDEGCFPLDGSFKTYNTAGGAVKWKGYTDIVVGTDTACFYIKEGVVCAGVITQQATPEKIRVAIGTSDYAGLLHKSISVTSSDSFTVMAGGKARSYAAGQRFTVSDIENADLFGQDRVYIQSETEGGTIQITGLKRNWPDQGSPRYRGVLEISREDNGYYVVNELPLEEYLYAVVPSEMPSSYGVEVSKVQAVTARSYAYNQFYDNRYHAYGANVDDSVSCQVYNNIPENNTSIQAVDATKGQCLTYNGSVIAANFFSTSCGMTANSGEVWPSSSKVFPTTTSEYLVAKQQYEGDGFGDLTLEINADAFLKETSLNGYDSGFSWFRWNVTMTAEEIAASVNANLRDRFMAAPALIKTSKPGESGYISRYVDSIGQLVDLEITKRGQGGNIMEMVITGTEASLLVSTEYNIRMLIRPSQYGENGRDILLNRADGTTVANYNIMPSAFYVFDTETDGSGNITSVTFYGGGNGHGAGMSQNGVKGMIDKGFTFEEVLLHYYPKTAVKTMY